MITLQDNQDSTIQEVQRLSKIVINKSHKPTKIRREIGMKKETTEIKETIDS
jgi:hypothetical protein